MLHYDIYRIIAMAADLNTLTQMVKTNCVISEPCCNILFWKDKLANEGLPLVSPGDNPINWPSKFEKLGRIVQWCTKLADDFTKGKFRHIKILLTKFDELKDALPGHGKDFHQLVDHSIQDRSMISILLYVGRHGNFNITMKSGSFSNNNDYFVRSTASGPLTPEEIKTICFFGDWNHSTFSYW